MGFWQRREDEIKRDDAEFVRKYGKLTMWEEISGVLIMLAIPVLVISGCVCLCLTRWALGSAMLAIALIADSRHEIWLLERWVTRLDKEPGPRTRFDRPPRNFDR